METKNSCNYSITPRRLQVSTVEEGPVSKTCSDVMHSTCHGRGQQVGALIDRENQYLITGCALGGGGVGGWGG